MTNSDRADVASSSIAAPRVVRCTDLDAAIAHYTGQLGFRLDMIMPADAPRTALVSNDGVALRLEVADDRNAGDVPHASSREPLHGFAITRADVSDAWINGRAGMQYRDLIPGRLGGGVIASHIRIPDGGPVPDYVHYHKIGFQMIYCKHGWVRVVYEDQGPPFVMHEGDCVLQPPTIRHRVLESSPGLEVIEVGCPAEHETWRDHELTLPTSRLRPDRFFGGQRFVRHVAADAIWQRTQDGRCEFRDTGISDATYDLADVRVLRVTPGASTADEHLTPQIHDDEFRFLFVLEGRLDLVSRSLGTHALAAGDACVIPEGVDYALDAPSVCEVLEVALARQKPARVI